MTKIAARLALLGALAVAAALPAQDRDWSQITISTTPLAPGIAMLQGAGGNLGVLHGPDGVLLIDDQFAPLTEKIRAAIAALSQQPLRFVINTHWHGDHTGGNENLGKAGAIIVAQDNVRTRMSVEQFLSLFNEKVPPSPAVALPIITFGDSVTFHLDGEEVRVQHVPPAHTDGDAFVYFAKADVLHAGDLLFTSGYPVVDLDSGGSFDGMIAAADRLLAIARETTKIIPGHGPLATRADLQGFRDMLAGIRAAVAKQIAAGRSLEETIAAKPTAPWDEKWGKGFIKPDVLVRIAYTSLAKR